jgi:hypothetical protein
MPEWNPFLVVTACCGFLGGYLAPLLTRLTVEDLKRKARDVAHDYMWSYPTGRGPATRQDVWRFKGGGPAAVEASLPWIIFFVSATAAALMCIFPPPLLGTPQSSVFANWMNALVPVAAFTLLYWIGRSFSPDKDAWSDRIPNWLLGLSRVLPAALFSCELALSYGYSLSRPVAAFLFAAAAILFVIVLFIDAKEKIAHCRQYERKYGPDKYVRMDARVVWELGAVVLLLYGWLFRSAFL